MATQSVILDKFFKGNHLDLTMFQAVGDAREIAATVAISSGTPTLVAASPSFSPNDIGKTICVLGAGVAGADLITTVAGCPNDTTLTLAVNAGTTITVGHTVLGTDNAQAISDAIGFAKAQAATRYTGIFIPAGRYLTTQTVENDTSFEWRGVGVDNEAASMFVYVGTGIGWFMHASDDAAWEAGTGGSFPVFAINTRNVGIACYGGCTDAVQIRNLSQGIFHRLTINDTGFASAQRCLNIVNGNILSFYEPIFVGGNVTPSQQCITLDSTGFPRDITNIKFFGGNLYRNGVVFDIRGNLTGLIVRSVHIEEFSELIRMDNGENTSAPLQVENCIWAENEILGNLGLFPTGSLIFNVQLANGINSPLRPFYFIRNRIFFVAAQLNPVRFNIGNLVTSTINFTLRDNVWSEITTSLVKITGGALTLANFTMFAENNNRAFGSAFTLFDAASAIPEILDIPAYGGEALTDQSTIARSNNGHLALANGTGQGCTPGTIGARYFNDHLEIQVDPNAGGQLRIFDNAADREIQITVPTTTFTALLETLGSLGAWAIRGNVAIGPNVPVDPVNTLHVKDASAGGSAHTSVLIEAGANDTTGAPLFKVHTSGGDVIIEQGGSIKLPNGAQIWSGSGSPEGVVTAPAGSAYSDSGGALYVKASGSGNTGWVSISNVFWAVIPTETNAIKTLQNVGIQTNPNTSHGIVFAVNGPSVLSAIGIGGEPTTDFEVFGSARIHTDITNDGLTASRPVKTDGSKKLISGKISGTSSADFDASSIAAGHFVGSDGSVLQDAGVYGLSATINTSVTPHLTLVNGIITGAS